MLLFAAAFLALAVYLVSCHEHEHEHDQGDTLAHHASQITVWENGLEAFVEYDQPVVNLPTHFTTHISNLATGGPRQDGGIVFAFKGPAAQSFEHTEEHLARDGIYVSTITFPSAGVWKPLLRVPLSEDDLRKISLPDVTVYASNKRASQSPSYEESRSIAFLKEQQWKLAMRTGTVSKTTMSARRKFPGHVLPKTGSRVVISSPLAGRIVGVTGSQLPTLGRRVSAGEVLALVEPTLPSSDLLTLAVKVAEAESEELRASQALKLANATLARVTRLQKVNAASTREVEAAQFAAETAKAAHNAAVAVKAGYESARALTKSYRSSTDDRSGGFGPLALRAPIGGFLVQVNAAPGEQVSPGNALFVVLDSSTVYVDADIPQFDAASLGSTPRAYIELPENSGRRVERTPITLLYSGLEVDVKTHTVPLVYEVENREGRLRVGMPIDVFVEVAAPRDALAIPESALVDEDGKYVVYIQLAGESFEKRELSLGIRDHGNVEVLKGLAAGERVVTSEAWSIRLAALSTKIPAHGHEH